MVGRGQSPRNPARRRRRRRPVQLELPPRGRGGRRPGAGRKKKPDAGVTHTRRERLASRHPVLVTMRVVEEVTSLRRRDRYAAIVGCIRAAQDGGRFRVVHFSVMGNHIHMIVEAVDQDALARGMQGLSVRLARALNRAVGRKGPVFTDRYHARVLKTPRHVRWGLRYVLSNARKHGHLPGGRRSRDWVDRYSSGCWFDGWSRPVTFPYGRAPLPVEPPTREPKTWLLRVGWRRHGLLDPASVPSAPDRGR